MNLLMSLISSTIIEDIKTLCESGQASMAYFYFDFRNANKQGLHDLLSSLLTQLSARSTPRCDILSKLYSDHDDGKMQPSDSVLTKSLKDMLSLPGQHSIYLIMDALDESPITSGIPSARESVLQLLKELVDLGFPNLNICATSRPEIDIRNAIEPLTSLRVSLHDQTGQNEDIAEYVRSIVYSNSDTNMKRWKKEDKELVVRTLAERADGMYVTCFMFLMPVSIIKQVPLGVLPVGNPTGLSPIERSAFS
jgi:ankyrin repeat domain-containing protein 50